MHNSSLHLLLKSGDFLNTDISQGSVATYLRCGGIFKYQSVENLSLNLFVKEFLKSVNIWRSYGQEFSVLFFIDSRCICTSEKVFNKMIVVVDGILLSAIFEPCS